MDCASGNICMHKTAKQMSSEIVRKASCDAGEGCAGEGRGIGPACPCRESCVFDEI